MSAEQDREPALSQASMPAGAVFLSYASEDAAAAERIASALRSGGIEVWFDKSELRGGDAWDRRIREQIHDCRLFVPVISANSERRDEGYFRREWSLAAGLGPTPEIAANVSLRPFHDRHRSRNRPLDIKQADTQESAGG